MSKLMSSTSATRSTSAMFLVALSHFFFAGSMLMWMIFLWSGSLNVVRLDGHLRSNEVTKLGLKDIALSMAFFIQHSTMIRKPFRRFLTEFLAAEYRGIIIRSSGVVLAMVVVFSQESTYIVVAPTGILVRLLMRALFVLAIQACRLGGPFSEIVRCVWCRPYSDKNWQKEATATHDFEDEWPLSLRATSILLLLLGYCFGRVRTLPSTGLFIRWCGQIRVVVGSFLEERDLVMDFGDQYRDYQRKVPDVDSVTGHV